MSKRIPLLAALVVLGLAAPALAQEATPTLQRSQGETTQDRLMRLSELLGELHYVRSLCDPQNPSFWRDRMNEMIRLEKPPIQQRNDMIGQFNTGYNEAKAQFTTCTDQARSLSEAAAREGEGLARQLGNAIDTAVDAGGATTPVGLRR